MKKVTLADGNEYGKFNLSYHITNGTITLAVADMITKDKVINDVRLSQDEIETHIRDMVQEFGQTWISLTLENDYAKNIELLGHAEELATLAFPKFYPEIVPIQEVIKKVNQEFIESKGGRPEAEAALEMIVEKLDDKIKTPKKKKETMKEVVARVDAKLKKEEPIFYERDENREPIATKNLKERNKPGEFLAEDNRKTGKAKEIYTPEEIKANKEFERTFENGGKQIVKPTRTKSKAANKAKKTVKA